METELNNNKVKFLYKVEKGISAVKGGFHVLSDMNYPKEILEGAKE
jgi:DNA mismatch repair ATPase MutS